MAGEKGVVDRDSTVEAPHRRFDFRLDKQKAALHGISTETVVQTLRVALEGGSPATVHEEGERQPLLIAVRLPVERRSGREELGRLKVRAGDGSLVPLDELGNFSEVAEDQPIYHKNLERVVYVFAEAVGRGPVDALLAVIAKLKKSPLPDGFRVDWGGEGEWKVTKDSFRDLGLAFGCALVAIYVLLVYETNKFGLPLLIMVSIPLTFIGIMPGFFALKLIHSAPVGGYANPVFFTATAMIGTIALAGIVVRNSIILIDFVNNALKSGTPLKQALLDSGAVRFRPILLTASTTMLGAWPITTDPIFSGLAWALIFGLFASTVFTLFIIPVCYQLLYAGKQAPSPSD
jgi:multidrug efflux pump subunit AcrB